MAANACSCAAPISPGLDFRTSTMSERNSNATLLSCRLHSGWSAKTANLSQWKQPDPITAEEHEKILKVIERAENMDMAEMHRIG